MRSIRTYLKLALLCTVPSGFVGCSNNEDFFQKNTIFYLVYIHYLYYL